MADSLRCLSVSESTKRLSFTIQRAVPHFQQKTQLF